MEKGDPILLAVSKGVSCLCCHKEKGQRTKQAISSAEGEHPDPVSCTSGHLKLESQDPQFLLFSLQVVLCVSVAHVSIFPEVLGRRISCPAMGVYAALGAEQGLHMQELAGGAE